MRADRRFPCFFLIRPSGGVAARGGCGVVLGAPEEGLLALLQVLALAGPGLQRRGLQRAAVGEAEIPRQRAGQLVPRVQVLGGERVALATGEKDDRSEEHTSELQSLMRI